MSPFAGPLFAAALLLGVAGLLKAVAPDPTRIALRTAGLPGSVWIVRLLAAAELSIAAVTIVGGGRLGAALIALTYAGFAGFSLRIISTSRGRASCGCFGASDAPMTKLHVIVNLLIVAVAIGALLDPVSAVAGIVRDTPLSGIVFLAFAAVLAWLVQVALTAIPELQAAARGPRSAAR